MLAAFRRESRLRRTSQTRLNFPRHVVNPTTDEFSEGPPAAPLRAHLRQVKILAQRAEQVGCPGRHAAEARKVPGALAGVLQRLASTPRATGSPSNALRAAAILAQAIQGQRWWQRSIGGSRFPSEVWPNVWGSNGRSSSAVQKVPKTKGGCSVSRRP